jgi:hypothetical protein
MEVWRMKKPMATHVSIIILVTATLSLNCCVLTLGALGAIADTSSPPSKSVQARDVMILEPGRKVTLILKDGHALKGTYLGVKVVPETEYASQYQTFLAQTPSERVLPALNDTLTVVTGSAKDIECIMRGFDYESICVSPIGQESMGQVRIDAVVRLGLRSGSDVDLKCLRELLAAGVPPCRTVVMVKAKDTTVSLEPSNIRQVVIYQRGNAAVSGAVIGAVCDGLLVVFLSWRLRESEDSCMMPPLM